MSLHRVMKTYLVLTHKWSFIISITNRTFNRLHNNDDFDPI